MSFRKKSSTSTEESSSTSFTESTSSCSSSGTDSGTSSTDSETSSTIEEKETEQIKSPNLMQKGTIITRRRSCDIKAVSRLSELEKKSTSISKLRSSSFTQSHRLSKSNEFSSEDEIHTNKKQNRLLNTSNATKKKKQNQGSFAQNHLLSTGGGKAPPAVVKQHQQHNFTSKSGNKGNSHRKYNHLNDESNVNSGKQVTPIASSDNSDLVISSVKTISRKPICANKKSTSRIRTSNILDKGFFSTKLSSSLKTSDESQSETASTSAEGSISTSDTDPSDTSNSYSHTPKNKSKRVSIATDYLNNKLILKDRKHTRSLSTRKSKTHFNRSMGGGVSETESDMGCEMAKYSYSKSPTKKGGLSTSTCKQRKEDTSNKLRAQSPLLTIEKKCSIEGCDSSGHLSGNQDKHFLPEACPIFHNMSASECKERASDRSQREKCRKIDSQQEILKNSLTIEQKEFLTKIRESRTRFRPSHGTEKIKVEKYYPDDDREPSLSGLVPDYDLQLFREAQAIASEKVEGELNDLPVGKGIKYITMGKYKMKVWYQSPYPDDAARLPKMFICEFCLRYQKSETGIKRHAQKCIWRHPPGDEIYRKGKLQVWQVDGKRHKQYCQHLCLLAKFFLDHKTLYYDVEPFLFYIMTLADVDGCHTVGYFSKEKNSFYNVSCILTLPPYQRKGYGRLLIDFSYLLTRVEGKIGSPEKPLSDLGLISYRSYWKDVLLDYLCNRSGTTLSIKDVSQEMAIYSYDIVSTLQALGMMKYWKGKHIVLKKQDVLDEYEERIKRRGNFPKIDDNCLRWSPFVPPQTNTSL